MKTLLTLTFSGALLAQEQVTSPLQVLAPNDNSASSVVQVQDQAQHFIGFIAPALVTQIEVSSATAANPMVLTLANPRPTSVLVGGTVTLSGAAGAGCSGMNATHPVSAVGASTITITFNGTGCTYTAGSADLETNIYWELPAADGVTGDCLGWSAAYVLDFVSCGGSSPPFVDSTSIIKGSADATKLLSIEVDGFTTGTTRTLTPQNASYTLAGINIAQTFSANQTLGADLLAGTDNTYKLGDANRWYQVAANRFEGTCGTLDGMTCVGTNNYVKTRKLELLDYLGLSNFGTNIKGIAASGSSQMSFTDNADADMVTFTRQTTPSVTEAKFFMHVVADSSSWTLGKSTSPWSYGYFTDVRAAALAGVGARTICADADGDIVLSGCPGGTAPFIDTTAILYSAATPANTLTVDLSGYTAARTLTPQDGSYILAGTNRAQTFTTGDQTFAVNILPSGVRDIGQGANPFSNAYFTNSMATQVRVASSLTSPAYYHFESPATSTFRLYSGNGGQIELGLTVVSATDSQWSMRGTLYPGDSTGSNGYIGSSSLPWRGAYLNLVDVYGTSSGSNYSSVIRDTGGSPGINFYSATTTKRGSLSSGATAAFSFQNGADTHIFTGFQSTGNIQVGSTTDQGFKFYVNGTANIAGTMRNEQMDGFGTRCAQVDNSGDFAVASTECIPNSRTISTTSPLGGGGDLSANRTLTCTTCVTNVTGTSPISSSGGTTPAISCSTCVTTEGGQSISGTTTLSTASISTAISGTFNLSGNMTVTGNYYARTFSGGDASCGSVADGWLGIRTDTNEIQVCIGGAMKKALLI